MAKDSKSTGGTAVEVVARRVRSLTDEILEAARPRGGEARPTRASSRRWPTSRRQPERAAPSG